MNDVHYGVVEHSDNNIILGIMQLLIPFSQFPLDNFIEITLNTIVCISFKVYGWIWNVDANVAIIVVVKIDNLQLTIKKKELNCKWILFTFT